jgi:hypothetical protein
MASRPFKLNLADIQMGMDLYNASPDGQAEQQRIRDTIAALPHAEFTIGYWVCSDGRCGTCWSCREGEG